MDQEYLHNLLPRLMMPGDTLELSTNRSYLINQYEAVLNQRQAAAAAGKYVINLSQSVTVTSGTKSNTTQNSQLTPQNCVDILELCRNKDKVLDGKYFLCRSIAPQFKMTAIMLLVEDPQGSQAIRMSLYNFSEIDDLPVGTILAVKNPWFKFYQDGNYALRSDNPSHVVIISEEMFTQTFPSVQWKGSIPAQWQKYMKKQPDTVVQWKNKGNQHFVVKKYGLAIQCYTEGINIKEAKGPGNGDALDSDDIMKDLLSNRAAAFTNLGCYQKAIEDLEQLLEIDSNHTKGIYRMGKVLVGAQRFLDGIEFLNTNLPNIRDDPKPFQELIAIAKIQYKQQITGEYDIPKLYSARGTASQVDIADYTGPVCIQSIDGKGRGLVATKDIKAGRLIIVHKAFGIAFPRMDSIELNINFTSKYDTVFTTEQRNLVKIIAQKLQLEPELGRAIYPLCAGPEVEPWVDGGADKLEVDMTRIDAICTYNSFSGAVADRGPTARSMTLKDLQQGESCGLWILASYINHSCWNCNSSWIVYGDVLIIRAVKDIKAGDEILITYVCATRPLEDRDGVLMGKHRFICTCDLCTLDRDKSEIGKKRIQLLSKISALNLQGTNHRTNAQKMSALVRELKNLKPKNMAMNNPSLLPILSELAVYYCSPGRENFGKSSELSIFCHEIAEYSPMNSFTVFASINLVTCYLKAGNVKEAKKWTEIFKRNLMLVHGTLEIANDIAGNILGLMAQFGIFLN